MKKTWQEYAVNDRALYEWLPWGGQIHDSVLKNKDESLMGVFTYTMECATQVQPDPVLFKNGWAIWTEVQKIEGTFHCYMVVLWNPFFYKNEWIINSLSEKAIHYDNLVETFVETLQRIEKTLKSYSDIRLLQNEESLSFLFSTLAMGNDPLPSMDNPLYLDAIFDKAIPFKPMKSTFCVNHKYLGIVSLLGYPDNEILKLLPYDNFRFSRRMLFFGEKEAKNELERYTRKWCEKRNVFKSYITNDLLTQFNGYYTNNLIFYNEDKDQLDEQLTDIDINLQNMSIPHIVETTNLKDIWWGTLPGIFRANLNPPIVSLMNLKELMVFIKKEESKNV